MICTLRLPTNYIILGNRKVHSDLNIKIHNDKIIRVSETKFLGVWIDKKYNWKTSGMCQGQSVSSSRHNLQSEAHTGY